MSATSGNCTSCLMHPKASAASMEGTETLTISAPALARRWICATVASTSQVSVSVMLCTEIGASPPTGTLPTQILRDRSEEHKYELQLLMRHSYAGFGCSKNKTRQH